jgi:surfeit locus 1 family protein
VSLKTLNSRFWLITVAAIVAAAVTMKLGFWQQNRAHDKLALQASIQAQAALPNLNAAGLLRATSISTSEQGANAPNVLHRAITLTGHWLPQHTLFLDNRQMDAKPGLFVLTPFEFDDASRANKKVILVQRGWLPRNFLDRNKLPDVATDTAQVTIVGRIALSPSKLFEFKGADKGALRQNIAIEALSKEIKIELLPYSLLQLDQVDTNAAKVEAADQKERGAQLLRNWSQPSFGAEKNYGYMVQWWALSALIMLLYAWFQFIRPAMKSKNSNNSEFTSSHITKKESHE